MCGAIENSLSNVVSEESAIIDIREEYGWIKSVFNDSTCWFKGHLFINGECVQGGDAGSHLAGALTNKSPKDAGLKLREIDGHFAFACKWRGGHVLLAVDRMRTIPLAYGRGLKTWIIDDQALRLRQTLNTEEPDLDASLEIAMAGYSLGNNSLFKEIKQLQTGELAIFESNRPPIIYRYDRYRAWEAAPESTRENLIDQLKCITERIFKKLADDLKGRKVMLPLSAGLDSRLIASGLKHVGYENVQCYAYGLSGNFEAAASQDIASRLGYSWTFIPYSREDVSACTATSEFRDYLKFADTLCAVPFVQDFLAVRTLRDRGLIPEGAVFINGNSGDFISGGHIQPQMHHPRRDLDSHDLRKLIVETALSKHFSLWQDLCNPGNKARIRERLKCLIDSWGPTSLITPKNAHGFYERLEFESRQAKYVISGERVYEFFGYDWRLPLWDGSYVDFWSRVPLEHKVQQSLYIEFLQRVDWGGVWNKYVPKRWVSPTWIQPLRTLCKIACIPIGRNNWHRIERRLFTYFTDILCTHATVPVPYSRYLFSRRGARHSMAFRCENYLRHKGRNVDGSPINLFPPKSA
jgi:asparagine synthase (glutamine-hydrolysing)